jgi:hypothetical protein
MSSLLVIQHNRFALKTPSAPPVYGDEPVEEGSDEDLTEDYSESDSSDDSS